jgi:hypothetical protein
MGEPTPPAPQSNQNAGKDAKPCRWCQLWNVAFAASRLPVNASTNLYMFHYQTVYRMQMAGVAMMNDLARRKTNCPGCQRSAEIYLGDVLGDEQAEWRAEMWEINPSMRFMMRQGRGDAEFSP